MTKEVGILSVVQKLLLSVNYIVVGNVGSHAFRHNYIFLLTYIFNIFNFKMLIEIKVSWQSAAEVILCNIIHDCRRQTICLLFAYVAYLTTMSENSD